MSMPAETGAGPSRTKLTVALLVLVTGLIVLAPNAWVIIQFWRVDTSETVTARWVSSVVTHSSRDTVAVPAYAFERRIGPMVQECKVDIPRYRHAPDGKPLRETLRLVAGTTCEDVTVLDDPPRERFPLVLLGLAISAAGLALAWLALRRP
ncbi:hypothetical protein E8L99_15390 [Phreatobacter aquaticus]|uniref:Uncharacterized protein n=1 Tax=Phreatobacter aquaticus TaxID=2570229 RepID=A0A4D7QQ50_9HYPH|nr:hypothetical protein [Phreatobacter aquaticus]QCK87047.1 hypothetical protein E8L99_15390 [Phreatobacter aquaticus]